MIKILLVDDHKIFTEGVTSLLAHEADFEVIAECQNTQQVKEVLQKNTIDVILLDINLGNESGLDLCKYLKETHPGIKVLAMSMYNEESFITKMLKNGALGYILKNTGAEELLRAIRTVYQGESYKSAEVQNIILNGISRQKNQSQSLYQIRFTRREKEILELIAQGKTTKEMGNVLCISEKTVETHRSNLLSKFNVKNVVSLLKLALEYGYVN